MADFTFFHDLKKHLGQAVIDFENHTFKAMLTNTAPDAAADSIKGDIVEIAAGNGYVAGGQVLTAVTWLETGAGTGVWRFTCNDATWPAAGGNIAEFQWVVIYDDTPTVPVKPLVGFLDYGTGLIITNGHNFTMDVGAGGVLELE